MLNKFTINALYRPESEIFIKLAKKAIEVHRPKLKRRNIFVVRAALCLYCVYVYEYVYVTSMETIQIKKLPYENCNK